MNLRLIFCWQFFLMILIGSTLAHAAKISKIQGKKVLILLEGTSAQVGDIFVAYNPEGKKKGLIRIKGVRNQKAVGLLGKGVAQIGWEVQPSTATMSSTHHGGAATTQQQTTTSHSPTSQRAYWGLMGGATLDNMSVDIDNTNDQVTDKTVSLKGVSFTVKGLFDYQLLDQIWFRGFSGLQGLSVTGDSTTEVGCNNKICSVDIYYLTVDFWVRYLFTTTYVRPWVGAGFSLLFPVTKEATAITTSSITNTSLLSLGAGLDWFIAPNIFIPIQLEYNIFPKSETVEANSVSLTAGLGLPF